MGAISAVRPSALPDDSVSFRSSRAIIGLNRNATAVLRKRVVTATLGSATDESGRRNDFVQCSWCSDEFGWQERPGSSDFMVSFLFAPVVLGGPIPTIGLRNELDGIAFESTKEGRKESIKGESASAGQRNKVGSEVEIGKLLQGSDGLWKIDAAVGGVPRSLFPECENWIHSFIRIGELDLLFFNFLAITDVELWIPKGLQDYQYGHSLEPSLVEPVLLVESHESFDEYFSVSEPASLIEQKVDTKCFTAPLVTPDFGISESPYFWWTEVGDPVLSRIIVEALSMNPTANESAARVVESRAFYDRAWAERYPVVGGSIQYDNRQFSQNGNAFLQKSASTSGFDFYAAGLESRWEVDLWGQLASRKDAAYAEYKAADFDLDDIRLSLISEIVQAYIELCLLNTQLVIAKENAEVMRLGVAIAQTRREAGKSGELDERLAKNQYTTTIAEIPALEFRRDRVIHRLMALRGIAIVDSGVPLKDYGGFLPVGNPSVPQEDIAEVFHRPDVKAAKKRLDASGLRFRIAKGDLLPKLTIDGRVSVDTRNVGSWFEDESIAYNVGPTLEWDLIDFGRRRADIRAADAELNAMKADFNRVLSEACEEVRNAVAELVRSSERAEILRAAAREAHEITTMALTEYQSGLGTFQGVLDAQRQRIIIEENAAITQANGWLAWVKYHRAIGAGGD